MKKRYYFLIVVLTSIFSLEALAQTRIVTGKVTTVDGELLPGASILVKGTTNGTTTSVDGTYSLQIPTDSVQLVYSFIGYLSEEISVGTKTIIDVALNPDIETLGEVVIVGYGTQSKATVTAATATIKGEDLNNVPTNTVSSKLQGRLAGVSVRTVSGQPGDELQIRVRGGSSINKSNDPLVIVDGFQRTLNDINPVDIESIDVLKDAAATAIYGSRASNGVILITTKRGKEGKSQLDFHVSYGVQQFNRQYELLSAEQYLQWWRPRIATSRYGYSEGWITGAQPTGTGNDENSTWTPRYLGAGEEVPAGWKSMIDPLTGETIIFQDNNLQKILYQSALQANYNLTATGGNDKMKYATSFAYTNQEGVAIGSNYERINGRVNLDFQAHEKIRLGVNTDVSHSTSNRFDNEADIFTRGVLNAPTIRYRFSDGTAGWGTNGTLANPLWVIETREVSNTRTIGTFGVNASWDIIEGLTLKGTTFLQMQLFTYDYFEKSNTFNELRNAEAERDINTSRQSEALLQYTKTLGTSHNMDFLLGFTDLHLKTDEASLAGYGGATDKITTLNAASVKTEASTSRSEERLISHFARVNYNYDLKYMLSATLRRDGSSKFASGHRFGYFPSVSAGWMVSRENFFPTGRVVDHLKLRASYGITGNNDVGRYVAQGVYEAGYGYGGNAATSATEMPNDALTWEKTMQIDFGIDIGLFDKGRLLLTADVYKRRTDDLLFTVQLPRESGFDDVEQNVGSVEYKGLELGVTSRNITTPRFSWTTSFNIAYNINQVIKLPYREGVDKNRINGTVLPDGTGFGGIAEGERMGSVVGYKVDFLIDNDEQAGNAHYDESANGYDPKTGTLVGAGTKFAGDFEWKDRDGNGRITSLDQFVLGYIEPTTTGGLTNEFSYRNFTCSIFLDYAAGHTIVDGVQSWMDGNKARRVATTTSVLDAWQKPGDAAITNQPRSDYHDQNHQNNLRDSDFYATRGDYICLRNVSLTYRFPQELTRMRVRNLELYAAGNNLYYLTAYQGPNPERGGTISNDSGKYPVFRTFTVGVRVGL